MKNSQRQSGHDHPVIWFTVVAEAANEGYVSLFDGDRHLIIDSKGFPLPERLPSETLHMLQQAGVPASAIRDDRLDLFELVAAGWTVSSALSPIPFT